MTKTCTKCGTVYPEPFEEWFTKNKSIKGGFCLWCKQCRSKFEKKLWKTESGKIKARKRKQKYLNTKGGKYTVLAYRLKKYGLSVEDYNNIFLSQFGKCAICGIHQSELNLKLQVDHNHKTEKPRGLLCTKCNIKLAAIEDKIFKVLAEEYLSCYEDSNA